MAECPTKPSDAARYMSAIRLSALVAVLILGVSLSLSMLGAATSTHHMAAHICLRGSLMLMAARVITEKPAFKAQSAMEYLMTYGWAILIISVVLGALYSMGIFSTSSMGSSSCIPVAGHFCSISSYSSSTGNIMVTIGQSTGTSWGYWGIAYCSQCTTNAIGPTSLTYNTAYAGNFYSGMKVTTALAVSPPSTTVGTVSAGSIWVCYVSLGTTYITSSSGPCTSGTNTVNFARIATITAKAS